MFEARLVYGANKRDQKFLRAVGVEPRHVVALLDDGKEIFLGTKQEVEAEEARLRAEAAASGKYVWLRTRERDILPADQFQVRQTAGGEVFIAAGPDTSPRCLLFDDLGGGFRGGCGLQAETTARILVQCCAANACESALAFAALLAPGQQVVGRSWGRRGDNITTWTWDGVSIQIQTYSRAQWEARTITPADGQTI